MEKPCPHYGLENSGQLINNHGTPSSLRPSYMPVTHLYIMIELILIQKHEYFDHFASEK